MNKEIRTLDYFPEDREFLVEPSTVGYDQYAGWCLGEQSGEDLSFEESLFREEARAKVLSYAPNLLRALEDLLENPDDEQVRRHAKEQVLFASKTWVNLPKGMTEEA